MCGKREKRGKRGKGLGVEGGLLIASCPVFSMPGLLSSLFFSLTSFYDLMSDFWLFS